MDDKQDSKPPLEMLERHRAIMQYVRAALELLAQTIGEAEAEGLRLAEQAAEFERATLRGESPDPNDVAQVQVAQAALDQRWEKLNGHIATMAQQAEAVTRAADAASFDLLLRQFNAQFNSKEGL